VRQIGSGTFGDFTWTAQEAVGSKSGSCVLFSLTSPAHPAPPAPIIEEGYPCIAADDYLGMWPDQVQAPTSSEYGYLAGLVLGVSNLKVTWDGGREEAVQVLSHGFILPIPPGAAIKSIEFTDKTGAQRVCPLSLTSYPGGLAGPDLGSCDQTG
jgi:hypothetical protein